MKSKKRKRRRELIEVSFKVRSDDALRWVLKKLPEKLRAMDGLKDLKVGMAATTFDAGKAGRVLELALHS
jgi:hypothetical protein